MSLQVWLPLNGNLDNLGLYELSNPTRNTTSILSDGKIGKCRNGSLVWHLQNDDIIDNQWSVTMWVKLTSTPGPNNNVLFCKNLADSNNIQIYLSIQASGQGLYLGVNSYSTKISTSYSFALNTWYHIAATYDGQNASLYVNGIQQASGVITQAKPDGLLNLCINGRGSTEAGTNTTALLAGGNFNDFRLYDHCLSAKEVEEIAKALILHYPLDNNGLGNLDSVVANSWGQNIVYDCSGYSNNGTVTGSLTTVTDTPRYNCATKFSGATTYINAGRGAMVRDAITISCWGYMDDWSTYNTRLISCTETGGWNFEPYPSTGGIQVPMGTGESSNTYQYVRSTTLLADLSSGWHLFTATYDGYTTKLYIDAKLEGSSDTYETKTPIYYNSTSPIFIGAEASSSATSPQGSYFKGNISDVRIYATALTEAQIKELYTTAATVDKNGNIYARELVEI